MKKLFARIAAIMLCMLVLVPVSGVSAVSEKTDEIGYDTYTYWYNFTGKTRKAVYSKPMYEVSTVLTAADLGCVSGSSLTDVHTTENGTFLTAARRLSACLIRTITFWDNSLSL